MVTNTKDSSKMVSLMAMDLILPKIYPAMLDILKIIKNMDKEKRFGLIRIAMRDNTVIIYNMD